MQVAVSDFLVRGVSSFFVEFKITGVRVLKPPSLNLFSSQGSTSFGAEYNFLKIFLNTRVRLEKLYFWVKKYFCTEVRVLCF